VGRVGWILSEGSGIGEIADFPQLVGFAYRLRIQVTTGIQPLINIRNFFSMSDFCPERKACRRTSFALSASTSTLKKSGAQNYQGSVPLPW